MKTETSFSWKQVVQMGLLAAVIALSFSVIGLVQSSGERDIVGGVFSMGHVFLFGATVAVAFLMAQRNAGGQAGISLLGGLVVGLINGLALAGLVLVSEPVNLRQFLANVSPDLLEMLTFGQGQVLGSLILVGISSVMGLAGAGLYLLPSRVRRPLITSFAVIILVGVLAETIILAWGNQGLGLVIRRFMFARRGLSVIGALIVFLIVAGLSAWWIRQGERVKGRVKALPSKQQRNLRWGGIALGIFVMLFLPMFLRTYLTEVTNNVGLYVLMGLGLNIVVGFAGLLDLGYVAFFAIGAYTMGVFTSQAEFGISNLSFWVVLPIAVGAAVLAGLLLGIPVLRMRGDYLAIITMGFGEIIRILAISDWLSPAIGGAQGVLQIPKIPVIGLKDGLVKPEQLYYVILAACLFALFIAWRLRDSRMGRQWLALREDEDVAEAMGINLVRTKLMAFAIGAGFAGMSGAIFATKLSSIFPHSFNMIVSINVLSLIIVGGMGSLPGVVVGALILVGLPELLREFAEYRMLMYGALLIVMMLARPEGFWPSEIIKREMHADEEPSPAGEARETEPV